MPDGAKAIRVKVAEYPDGFGGDIADLLNTPGGPAAFGEMIRSARDGPVWMIEHLDDVRGHDLSDAVGKSAAAADMVDILLGQPPIARAEYVRALARKLQVDEREIRQTLNEVLADRGAYYGTHPEARPPSVEVADLNV
jgi:hypothetical protein